MSLPYLLILCLMACSGVMASVHDCWDPEKLQRMKFDTEQNAPDPGLAQFSKMVKCLSQQQGKGPGQPGGGSQDWNQWSNFVGGQFFPNWNANNQDPNRMQPTNNWNSQGPNNNDWNSQSNNDWGRAREQPKPGVHPDDFGRNNDWRPRPNVPDTMLHGPGMGPGQPNTMIPQQPPQQSQPPNSDWSNPKDRDARKRERENRKREREERRRVNEDDNDEDGLIQPQPPPGWGGQQPNPIDPLGPSGPLIKDLNPLMTPEETTAVTVSRKYGYAIMALSVVVLAVLMVATIFCCNSSNSTMNQAGNQQLAPVNQYDTYSIYSYKGGAVADTLRSTGTLGGMSMHTETMKSRGSPQYRVSDIDPDFARRYKEAQQY